jgi:hypothetical protein
VAWRQPRSGTVNDEAAKYEKIIQTIGLENN